MAKHRDTVVAMTENLFDIHDIQGNVLAGFNKDYQLLMAFRLRDLIAARASRRAQPPTGLTDVQVAERRFLQLHIHVSRSSAP